MGSEQTLMLLHGGGLFRDSNDYLYNIVEERKD